MNLLIIGYYLGLIVFALNGLIWFCIRNSNKEAVLKLNNILYVHRNRMGGRIFRSKK